VTQACQPVQAQAEARSYRYFLSVPEIMDH